MLQWAFIFICLDIIIILLRKTVEDIGMEIPFKVKEKKMITSFIYLKDKRLTQVHCELLCNHFGHFKYTAIVEYINMYHDINSMNKLTVMQKIKQNKTRNMKQQTMKNQMQTRKEHEAKSEKSVNYHV